jgi:hypothetical protein
MPYAGDGLEVFGTDEDRTGTVSIGADQAVAGVMQTESYNPLTQVLGYAIGGAVDLVDTVGSSLPGFSSATDWNREDLNHAAVAFAGSPGVAKWYEQNKGGLEVASGIAGVVGAELIARRFTAPASAFMGAMRSTPYLRRIAVLDREAGAALETVNALTRVAASRGISGTAMARTEATLLTSAAGPIMPTAFARSKELWKAKGFAGLAGVRDAAATEAVMALGLNQNGFLYDESMAYNLAFGAMGLGIGGGIQAFSIGYKARKFANSDLMRRATADALDPEGVGAGRLGWKGLATSLGGKGELNPGDWLAGSITDRISDLNVNISKLRESPTGLSSTDNPQVLAAQRNKLANELGSQMTTDLNRVTSKGISTNGQTRFNQTAQPYWNHTRQLLDRDPFALQNAEMLGGVPDNIGVRDITDAHFDRVGSYLEETETKIQDLMEKQAAKGLTPKQKVEFETAQSLAKRLRYEQELTPMVSVDGEWMPLSEGESISKWVEPEIIVKRQDSKTPGASVFLETKSPVKGGGVTLDSNLSLTLPGGKSLEKADLFDVMRGWHLADKMIDSLGQDTIRIALPAKPTWFQLDVAEEMMRRNANAEIVYPGKMTRESAQVESFVQKAKSIKQLGALDLHKAMKANEKGLSYSAQLSQARIRFNLPKLSAYERGLSGSEQSPVDMLLRGMGEVDEATLRTLTPQDLKEGIAQFRRIDDVVDATANDVKSLMGNAFKFGKGENGETLKPLVGMFRKFSPEQWSVDHVAERMANRKARTVNVLTANPNAPMTKGITESIINSADFELVSRPDMLNDLQIQGSVFGSMPGTGPGALSRTVKTSEHIARDTPGLLAAIRLRDTVSRITRDNMRTTIETAFGDTLKVLNNGRNQSSKLLLDQYHSLRSGWDVEKEFVKTEDGFWATRLGDTEGNRERWKAVYGKEMPVTKEGVGPILQSYEGRPIVLDDLAKDIQERYGAVTEQLIREKNSLLSSQARSQINLQNHFVPSPDVQGKHIAFVVGPDGKTVPGFSVVEDTQAGFEIAMKQLESRIKELPGNGMGYVTRTQDDIRKFTTIWDRADMEMFDPNITAIQPGKKARGALVGREVKTDAFQNSLRYLQDQYLNHGNDIMQVLLREQIDGAKARAAISTSVVRDAGGKAERFRSVHDYYLENLLGQDKLTNPSSLVGPVFKGAEKAIDKVLEGASNNGAVVWDMTNRWFRERWGNFTGKETEQGVKDFNALSEKLGDYMPFASAQEMTARKFAGVDPMTTAKITSGVNRFSAAMMLRIMEIGQPIMNMAGIINAMPSVIRHFQPSIGESTADYAARIGHSATIFKLDDGRAIGIADMAKIGKRSLQRAWSRKSHPDYDFMMKRGYLSQEVAEFQKQFGAINTPGASREWMGKMVDHLSILSDRSEDLSRSWGHMVGLELADILKIEGMETRHAFAHDMANKMIANYNPANRPEVFQGALGAPLGLFQSFVQNYYQRLFRYIETKDARAFATQYATQSALFGITGLAGYKELMGTVEAVSGADEHPAGGFLGHGLLGQIPALFGGSAVDFSSRGDTSVRVPGVGTQQLPGMAVASKLYEGVSAALGLFLGDNPNLTATQVAEVLSNTLANRPISGLIEQFGAGGLDTDSYGQVVSESRGWMEQVYRGLGLRSQRQAQELEAYYSDKNAMEHKSALDDRLRTSTRAAMREGNFGKLPTIFESYLNNGGDPKHFKRWMKENYEAATTTRAERQLEKLLKNPAYFDRAQRMMDMGVSIDANETYSDDDMNAIMGQTKTLLDDYYDQQGSEGTQIPMEDPESPFGM